MRRTKKQIEDEKLYGGRTLFDFIELEFTGGRNEQQNRELSKHREITNDLKRNSISSDTSTLGRQENSTIQSNNTREMGGNLSQHNQSSRNVRINDTSTSTSGNGTRNFREQGSGTAKNTGNHRYGDTSRSANQSQSFHSSKTTNLFSFVSRDDESGQETDARGNNQQSILGTTTRNDGFERRSFKSEKLDFISDDEVYLGSLKDRFQKNIQAVKKFI
nr:hypothetical protein [Helicobacter sp. 15-1451]